MSRTVLHVLPHTHWDREWYEPFEGYRFRLVRVVDELLALLDREPGFHFHFDAQTAAIEDYLAVRPHERDRVAAHVAAGRLLVGPWRILMDEFLCSPETIVRNLRQGLATATALGVRPRIGYIPDSFGHIAQMPQILRLAGMTHAAVWRGVPAAVDRPAFDWVAPDGTTMRTMYLATSYSNAATLPQTFEELMVRAKRIIDDMAPLRPGGVVLAMNGTDHLPPAGHLPALFADANARQDEIEFRIGPLAEYVNEAPGDDLPARHGEMRSSARANVLMGVVSARMPLKQAEFASSRALERYAEPFAAVAGYDPGQMLKEAWQAMVENSAHDSVCGCGIDAVAAAVAARYERALRIGDGVATAALTALGERIECGPPPGRAAPPDGLLIANPSPFTRSGIAEAIVALPDGAQLAAPDGTPCPVQILDSTEQVVVDMTVGAAQLARIVPTIHSRMMGTLYVNRMDIAPGRVRTIRLELGPIPVGDFDVEDAKRRVEDAIRLAPRARFRVHGTGPPLRRLLTAVPAIGGLGWTTLFPVAPTSRDTGVGAGGDAVWNEQVRIEAREDGTVTLIGGGAHFDGIGLRDGGDAGDEYTYSPPARDTIVGQPFASRATIVSDGPLEARLRITQRWRIPQGLDATRGRRARRRVELPVTIEWAVRAGEPFARLDIALDNVANDHRLRLQVPLPFAATGSDADTAFHVTRRGLLGESAIHEVNTPTFPARRWVDVSGDGHGIAVMHTGTPEYEVADDGRELAVTLLRCVGWLARQDLSTRSGPAGPMLATPGAQLIGSHRFSLALHPHAGDWRAANVHRVAETFTYPLATSVIRPRSGTLPPSGAALTIEPAAVQLSALERRADGIEARIVNAGDGACTARIRLGEPFRPAQAFRVDLIEGGRTPLRMDDDSVLVPLGPWEIATVRLA